MIAWRAPAGHYCELHWPSAFKSLFSSLHHQIKRFHNALFIAWNVFFTWRVVLSDVPLCSPISFDWSTLLMIHQTYIYLCSINFIWFGEKTIGIRTGRKKINFRGESDSPMPVTIRRLVHATFYICIYKTGYQQVHFQNYSFRLLPTSGKCKKSPVVPLAFIYSCCLKLGCLRRT